MVIHTVTHRTYFSNWYQEMVEEWLGQQIPGEHSRGDRRARRPIPAFDDPHPETNWDLELAWGSCWAGNPFGISTHGEDGFDPYPPVTDEEVIAYVTHGAMPVSFKARRHGPREDDKMFLTGW